MRIVARPMFPARAIAQLLAPIPNRARSLPYREVRGPSISISSEGFTASAVRKDKGLDNIGTNSTTLSQKKVVQKPEAIGQTPLPTKN